MTGIFNIGSSVIEVLSDLKDYIFNILGAIKNFFTGINFTILYNWLPADIATVITGCISILLVLAVFGLLRRLLFFLG